MSADLCFAHTSASTYCFNKKKKERKEVCSKPKETRARNNNNNNNNNWKIHSVHFPLIARKSTDGCVAREKELYPCENERQNGNTYALISLSPYPILSVVHSVSFFFLLFSRTHTTVRTETYIDAHTRQQPAILY